MRSILLIVSVLVLSSCGNTPIEIIHRQIKDVNSSISSVQEQARQECQSQYFTEEDIDQCIEDELNAL